MGINDFKASNGYINRFRERHGLVYRSVRGEAAGVNKYTVDTWKDRLQVLLNDYRPDDVFNADEMGLFYPKKDSLSCCAAMNLEQRC
ncbi:Tigger transposable element-derived protein 4 [Trichinella patagoniensis]|uniref:Tigger transposable element-derived protein 4 n=1 Tax=Trichinella patagoniensis TaxID=990121 RepID=A0A0V0YRW8_9BILA|nr:Tigger transposable element-derived protein 4 [Trichinella patagoniensis]